MQKNPFNITETFCKTFGNNHSVRYSHPETKKAKAAGNRSVFANALAGVKAPAEAQPAAAEREIILYFLKELLL